MASPITLCGSLSLYPVMLGARMHQAGYCELGLAFAYVPFEVRREGLHGALDAMRALSIRGLGVSMPFKLDVMPLLDKLDPLAEQIGAVNTIVNDDGVLTGYNTDAWGAARALEEAMPLAGHSVVVIGAGGAARAVVHSLASEGMRVVVVNRTVEKARDLARTIPGVTAGPLADLSALKCDAVVNCSSAGMSDVEGPSPALQAPLGAGQVVMDIVYKPIRTELLAEAEKAGARTVHGGRMLLHQAARQFELYTGQPAPLDAMDHALQSGLP